MPLKQLRLAQQGADGEQESFFLPQPLVAALALPFPFLPVLFLFCCFRFASPSADENKRRPSAVAPVDKTCKISRRDPRPLASARARASNCISSTSGSCSTRLRGSSIVLIRLAFETKSSYSLRHIFATYKAEWGVSPYVLREWLGHARLDTTQIVHMARENTKKAMEATSL